MRNPGIASANTSNKTTHYIHDAPREIPSNCMGFSSGNFPASYQSNRKAALIFVVYTREAFPIQPCPGHSAKNLSETCNDAFLCISEWRRTHGRPDS